MRSSDPGGQGLQLVERLLDAARQGARGPGDPLLEPDPEDRDAGLGGQLEGSDRPFLLASGIVLLKPGQVLTERDATPMVGPDAPRGGAEELAYGAVGLTGVPVLASDVWVAVAEEYLAANRAFWEGLAPDVGAYGDQLAHGRRRWAEPAPVWGDWSVPESRLRLLPDDVTGLDVLELGCGTGYVSAWLARLGARPVGVDLAARQLRIARTLQREHGLPFPLVQANAERPPLADRRFDLLVSEYGLVACDPRRWVPQAARLLRPGGHLLVLASTALSSMCTPTGGTAGDRLLRDYFGMTALHLLDDRTVEFQLPHGEWIRLLHQHGFEVDDLVEIQAPEGSRSDWPYVPLDWARRWPSEEVWKATRRG